MQSGKITRFLERCLRLGQCQSDYDFKEEEFRYWFSSMSLCVEEYVVFVYPKERRVRFLVTEEVWQGEKRDWIFGDYYDYYKTVVVEEVDRKNLSSIEAAKMLSEIFARYEHRLGVSKRSLRLLK